MADVSKFNVGGTTYTVKDAEARKQISELGAGGANNMGTVTPADSPTANNFVITDVGTVGEITYKGVRKPVRRLSIFADRTSIPASSSRDISLLHYIPSKNIFVCAIRGVWSNAQTPGSKSQYEISNTLAYMSAEQNLRIGNSTSSALTYYNVFINFDYIVL